MANMLNTNPIQEDSVAAVISSDNFIELSEKSQKEALDAISSNKEKEGGFLGRFFGNKKEIASMNIAFVICILLALIGWISSSAEKDYWDMIIPAITTGMGYMFGKGDT